MKPTAHTVNILGIDFEPMDVYEARKKIRDMLRTKGAKTIYTPNPDFLIRAYKNRHLSKLLRSADMLLPDGVGLTLAARLKGEPLPCRITGIDTAEWILSFAARKGLSVYLLGARPEVAWRAATALQKRFSGLRICGTHHGYFNKHARSADNRQILARINACAPDILFVCFGFPEQELWISENAQKIPSLRLCMGLGGSLDIWSGDVTRAPKLMQSMGLEWLWRTVREPRRIRTVARIPKFLIMASYFSFKKEK